jgi:hypothetical protein
MADEKTLPPGVVAGSTEATFAEAEAAAMAEFEKGAADEVEPEQEATEVQEDEAGEVEASPADESDEIVEDEAGEPEDAVAPTFDPAQWDGRIESLPENLRVAIAPIHKTMERGMHQKFQEIAALRKEYEQKLESLRADPTPSQKAETGPPPPPTADMTYDEQVEAQNKRDSYFAKKALEETLKTTPEFKQVEVLAKQQEGAARVQLVQSQPGFTPEIGAAMAQIAESHPYYASLLDTNEGALVLFQTAKIALENHELKSSQGKVQQAAANKAEADIKKKASAGQAAISRTGSTRKATPAENYAKWGFAEAEKAALEAWESGRV